MDQALTIQLGLEHHRAGRLADAEKVYRGILAERPADDLALNLLAAVAAETGRLDEAIALGERAVAIRGNVAGYYSNLGEFQRRKGDLAKAIASLRRAVELNPSLAVAYRNLGAALDDAGAVQEAAQAHLAAIALEPNSADSHYNFGNTLLRVGDARRAAGEFERAVQLNPSVAQAWYNLGLARSALNETHGAIDAYGRAVGIRPDYAEAWNNLGLALEKVDRLEEAVAAHRKVIALQPANALSHSNLGGAYFQSGRYDEAMAAFTQSMRLDPQLPDGHWNMGLLHLLLGNYIQAWPEYEWRWKIRSGKPNPHAARPLWDGSELKGKTILIHTEQGFGDAILFLRFVPMVAKWGGRVIVECPHELVSLFRTSPGVAQAVTPIDPLPAFDVQCPMMSLAGMFHVEHETIPREIPYIKAPRRFEAPFGSEPRVGLAWAGNPGQINDRRRSIDLQKLEPLGSVKGLRFYSLQKGERAAQSPPAGIDLVKWTDRLISFAETAGLIEQLDLVITVDTAVAHLAGAMGKAVWVLLPLVPPWHYGIKGESHPWYPTMRVFRQKRAGDWEEPIRAVAAVLQDWLAKAHYAAGRALSDARRFDEAMRAYQAAIDTRGDYAEAHVALGIAMNECNRPDDALAAFSRAAELQPDMIMAHYNRGGVLHDLGRMEEAIEAFQRAIDLRPRFGAALSNLGNVHKDCGNAELALDCYARAAALAGNYSDAHSNLLLAMHYRSHEPAEIFAEHRRWADRYEDVAEERRYFNDRSADRVLRVGYVSGDFGRHPVSYFLLPLLESRDRGRVYVTCYSTSDRDDEVTKRIRAAADGWVGLYRVLDDQARERIRADGIDILVDLSGHSAGNRLRLFARRPAPVQVTYLGYPDTTGMKCMDWRLTDWLADPAGAEEYYTEKLYRLDRTAWCFCPLSGSPAVEKRRQGGIVFGSFNNPAKISPEVLELWRRVLDEVPGSRMVLKEEAGRFAEALGRDRVELIPRRESLEDHLRDYGRIDVAVDTSPYHGTTTTCEAMWMGLPVVTMTGKMHCSRVGASLLGAAGMEDRVARDGDEYVRIAVSLANERPSREALRDRMARSPLMDGAGLAREVEKAYRQMWKAWVAK